MSTDPWPTIRSKTAYSNKWIRVVDHEFEVSETGEVRQYGVVETLNQAVSVVALDRENRVCLIEEYRFPIHAYLWRVPMGSVANASQSPLEAAQAELWEEAAVRAKNWHQVGVTEPMSGLCSERALVFVAREIVDSASFPASGSVGSEQIRAVTWVPFSDVRKMVTSGRLTDGQAIAALYMVAETSNLL